MTSEMVAETKTQTAMPAGLRLVLFGMPAAGKSSLLGALAKAAETQESALGFRLTDRSQQLTQLQKLLYSNLTYQTQAETVTYPVTVEPFDGAHTNAAERQQIVLVDCDGRVAGDLMATKTLSERGGALATEVRDADAIVLVVDASAGAVQIDADLTAAVQFLRRFQSERGQQLKTGGLPVRLVLSKCDLLAQPEDGSAAWLARVEAMKREVGERFRAFALANDMLDFGDIDLQVMATAVKQPALQGQPVRPNEPWGVAELFRNAFSVAGRFRQRQARSRTRLTWTTILTGALVGIFTAVGVAFITQRESLLTAALTAKVESYQAREGPTAATRLAEPLSRKAVELTDLEGDPEFPKIAPHLQSYVRDRLAEITAYRSFKERLLQLRGPADARSEEDLAEFERRLRESVLVPEAFAVEWKQTDAVLLREKWLDDVRALRAAAVLVADWYGQLALRANQLLAKSGPDWPRWQDEVAAVLREADSPPFHANVALPGSQALAGARALTYGAVQQYPAVVDARNSWQKVRGSLARRREMTVALGLTADGDRPAPLKLSERFAVEDAKSMVAGLRTAFPDAKSWTRDDFSESGALAALQSTYERVIDAGRREILRRLKPGGDTPARLRLAAAEMAVAPELGGWRELVSMLARWLDVQPDDPISALGTFLKQDRFDVELRGLRLVIPDDLKENRLRPQGDLVVSVKSADNAVATLSLRLADEGVRDAGRRATAYAFAPEGTGRLTLKPGDIIWAEVMVRDTTGQAWKLSWWSNGVRTSAYQFDRFSLPPRIHRPDQKPEDGPIVPGVSVVFVPERGWPRLPELLPTLR
jgi:GTPase SAR1 family protein